MGKKITKKKTKEIREVVGEASSASIVGREVSEQQQTQPRRKRGRPRKIIENTQVVSQGEEEKNRAEEQKEEEEAVAVEEGDSKRMKTSEEEKLKGIRSTSSSSVGDVKGGAGPSDESKIKEPPKSRRGRRKSQPRKSS